MTGRGAASPRSLMGDGAAVVTARLSLREVDTADASFILRLVNEPSFLQYIGDKGVRTLADACTYIASGPISSYAQHGFGLYLVTRRDDGMAVGTCGLLKRETLDDPDIGFAFLPEFWGQGYAFESAQAVIERGKKILGLRHLLAVTAPDNYASIGLLLKLGFVFDKPLDSFGDAGKSNLYALNMDSD